MAAKEKSHALSLIQALKKASKDLQNNPIFILCRNQTDLKAAIEALLELSTKANAILSADPCLSNISQSLNNLRELLRDLEEFQGYGVRSLFYRQITKYKISQIGYEIETHLRAYIDREAIFDLVQTLREEPGDEDEKITALIEFEDRLSQGFDRDYQELIMKAGIFSILESMLCFSNCSNRVKDEAALAVLALIEFNKDVFVGMVFMGFTIPSLISMGSSTSIRILSSLIARIRTPLIDELQHRKQIPRIINLLSSENRSVLMAAINCLFEIAFYGSKEVIGAMLEEELVQKLMELQRLKIGSDLENEDFAFEDCVKRFALQIEMGEGVENKKEKDEFKLEILETVRKASVSDAEAASIVHDILWGPSP
ncbi:hypothetical protein FEM48_Zijuj06G0138600 [Ziziphus jujuba var. spinosa]|uniref:Uncharacterized protein n=1 Tax=Ziziphus jujuba var. spinosa TaxID=714518 RepID=A0A978V9N5_ZIZJJ|nr:hypothetical protein FEM48_Zijuj06G0138600 [Ziziphus jujuba var. spinosa]